MLSNDCNICRRSAPESVYHFIVGYPQKSTVWLSILDKLSLSIVFLNLDEIRRALLFHKPTYFDRESGVLPSKFENRHLQWIGAIIKESGHITMPVF
jgi:hypothetical protein